MMFREIREIKKEEKEYAYTKIGADRNFSKEEIEELNTFWMNELLKASKDD